MTIEEELWDNCAEDNYKTISEELKNNLGS